MMKTCVICGAACDVKGNVNTCSPLHRKARRRLTDSAYQARNLDKKRTAARIRFLRNPEKKRIRDRIRQRRSRDMARAMRNILNGAQP